MSQASQAQREKEESGEPEVTWLGQQWRMDGYCGRAPDDGRANASSAPAEAVKPELRPVAVVRRARRSQGKVVRIGPPRETPAA